MMSTVADKLTDPHISRRPLQLLRAENWPTFFELYMGIHSGFVEPAVMKVMMVVMMKVMMVVVMMFTITMIVMVTTAASSVSSKNNSCMVRCVVGASVERTSGELQVGDRIIEVNGEPVQNQSLAEVCLPLHAAVLSLFVLLSYQRRSFLSSIVVLVTHILL